MNKQSFALLLRVSVIGLIVTTAATIALSFIINTPFWVFFFGLLFSVVAPLAILTIAWGEHGFKFDNGTEGFSGLGLFGNKSSHKPNVYTDEEEFPTDVYRVGK